MACYRYELINESDQPLLKNVDITIILMMENSNRFIPDPFILNLSRKTIIQYNKGFRACKKPSTILKSNQDITHAYYTAFEYSKNYKNVLILEEDAEILYYTKKHYDLVDKYISGNFKIFSFATGGVFTKLDDNFYSVDVPHGAHAQVISSSERSKMMRMIIENNFNGEIDGDYMKNSVVVYKHPLIVQLHPETENLNNWPGNKIIIRLGIKLIGIDKNKSAWEIIYLISKIKGILTFEIILLIFFIILFIYRK